MFIANSVGSLIHQTENMGAVIVIAAAFLGQRDTTGCPAEQRHADGFLKFAQMPGDRRLTGSQFAGDGRQVPTLGDADEGAHPLQCDVRSIHISAISYPFH